MTDLLDQFRGRTAFVTGGGGGIGSAAAHAFAARGASVAVVGRTSEKLEPVVEMIRASGGDAIAVTCDILEEEQIEAAIGKVIDRFGRLDFAFNNAGLERDSAPVGEIPTNDWDAVMNTNLRGTFLCMKHEIQAMLKRDGGSIVNTSSGAGIRGFAGNGAYSATKHGIIGLTKCAALDHIKQGIRINAICPGFVDTPLMKAAIAEPGRSMQSVIDQEPIGRPAQPKEIAAAVVWMCSDEASFMVGNAMVVDGGQTV